MTSSGDPRDESAPEPSDESLILLPLDSEVAEVIHEGARERVRHYLQEFALARATGWGTRRLPSDVDQERP